MIPGLEDNANADGPAGGVPAGGVPAASAIPINDENLGAIIHGLHPATQQVFDEFFLPPR